MFSHSSTIFKGSLLESAAQIGFFIQLNFGFVLDKCLKAQSDILDPLSGLCWSTADVRMAEVCRCKITIERQITNQPTATRSKFQNPFPIPFLRSHRKGLIVRNGEPTELHLNAAGQPPACTSSWGYSPQVQDLPLAFVEFQIVPLCSSLQPV